MANPNNNGTLIGRLQADPTVFKNADGSKTVLVNLMVDDNYKSGPKNEVRTNIIPLRVFVNKSVDGIGSWDKVSEGDLVAVNIVIDAKPYVKDGKTVYPCKIDVDGPPQFLESKATTSARRERKAAERAKTGSAATTPAPAEASEETMEQELARLRAEVGNTAVDYGNEDPFGA